MAGPASSRPAGGVSLSVDQRDIALVTSALRREADGKDLRKELIRSTKKALDPAVTEVKGAIMAMSSAGDPRVGPPLRQTIASRIRAEVRLSGRASGARIRAKKTPSIRGFANAPKRTNRTAGWRHQVYGGGWVHQTGRPLWFDNEMKHNRAEYRRAVLDVLEDMARRIASRSRR